MEMNKEYHDILQEYLVQPQLIDSGEAEDGNCKSDIGLKKVIQKMFIKYAILEWDNLKSILEDVDGADKLYQAICEKEGQTAAGSIFHDAIKEVQDFVAGEYDMAPRRKKEHELLAEQLDQRYGNGAIENNINRVIEKNGSSSIGDSCGSGGCGC